MNRRILTLILSSSLALYGCDTILQYPEGEGTDPTLIDVNLSIGIDMKLDEEPSLLPEYDKIMSDGYDIRYIAEVYRTGGSYAETSENLVERIVCTEDSMPEDGIFVLDRSISVHAGSYSLMIWVDFVAEGKADDLYYDTGSLHEVRYMMQGGKYSGYDISKDAFAGKADIDLTGYAGSRFEKIEVKAEVKRPFAVYKVIATDAEKIMPKTSEARYGLYFPLGYNVFYGAPDAFSPGIGYSFDVYAAEGIGEAVIASDMVFIDDEETFYYLDMDIISESGTTINSVDGLCINLSRNRMTVIKGQFITKEFENGGVGIDPGFDDEIVVPISRGLLH